MPANSDTKKETDGFKERSRLRDDVLDAMEQAYIKGKKEQLTLTDVVSTYCDCDKYHDRYEEANNNCNSCDKPLN